MFVSEPPSHLLLLEGSIGIQYSTFILCITPHHTTPRSQNTTIPNPSEQQCALRIVQLVGFVVDGGAKCIAGGDHIQLARPAAICKKTERTIDRVFLNFDGRAEMYVTRIILIVYLVTLTPHTILYVDTIETNENIVSSISI